MTIGKARVEVRDVGTTKLVNTLFEVTQTSDDLKEGRVSHRRRISLVVVMGDKVMG